MTVPVFSSRKTFLAKCLMLVFGIPLLLALPASSSAELSEMSNAQMAEIHGHGATSLYIEENTVRLFLDIHMETYGDIDSAKAGYYEKNGQYNWDMNWNNLTLGEAMDTPLVTDGLVFRFEFDDNDGATNNDITATNKQLKRIFIGTNHMDGQISGKFTTTTGAVHPGVVNETSTDPKVMIRSTDLDSYEALNITDSGFFIDINIDGTSNERGVKTIIGYPESDALNIISSTNWWQ